MYAITSLYRIQGTLVRGGSKLWVRTPSWWSKFSPSRDDAQLEIVSELVDSISRSVRHFPTVLGSVWEDDIRQLIRGMYSSGFFNFQKYIYFILWSPTNLFTWLSMQTWILFAWHSRGPCWQTKSHPPAAFWENLQRNISSSVTIFHLTLALPNGWRSTWRVSWPKCSQLGNNWEITNQILVEHKLS